MQGLGVVRLVLVASAVFALTACEGVKKQFGLTKQSPDEFRVVARAPLSLPPDFTLRPPEPGAVRPQDAWHWPAFNLADTAIVIGVLGLILDGLFQPPSSSKE